MKIYIGSDHRGFKLKKFLKEKLKDEYEIIDLGNHIYDLNDDFPDFAFLVGENVAKNSSSCGILICGSGAGVCMAANKVKGIRASVVFNEKMAKSAKEDDNLNILCLPSDYIEKENALKIIRTFLKTEFKNLEKYKRRINKINQYENKDNSFN